MPKVGIIQLWQEVNTYSPRPTELPEFRRFELAAGQQILDRHADTGSVIGGFLAESRLDPVPVFSAGAWPGGMPSAETAASLLARLREALEDASSLDGVFLNLHGAMVAEGHPDMELEAVRIVRDVVGAVPVCCVLDLHGIPSTDFVADVDAVLGYDTYPHIDMFDRGQEAAALLQRCLDGERLVSVAAKLPLLTTPLAQVTDAEPLRSLLDDAQAKANDLDLARLSLLPGFPYSDVERVGFSVVGIADESSSETLVEAVDSIAASVEDRAAEFDLERPTAREAVHQALASDRAPVVIADIADNVGGGGAGDGTALLAELIEQEAEGAVVTISDSAVATEAVEAGVGARLRTRLGGKLDRLHGDPVELEGVVAQISDGEYRSAGTYMTGQSFSLGSTVVLRVGGIDVVVTEQAVPPFHREQLTHLGLDPANAKIITAKGAVAWRAAFGEIAAEVIEADTPGVTPLHPDVLPRRTKPVRAMARTVAARGRAI